MKIDKAVFEFLEWKEDIKNISPATSRSYKWALKNIVTIYKNELGNRDLKDVKWEDVQKLLVKIKIEKVEGVDRKIQESAGYTSYNYIKGMVKQLFRYLGREDIIKKIGSTTLEEADFKEMSYNDIQNIIKIIPTLPKLSTPNNFLIEKREIKHLNPVRDIMIIKTLYSTGLRATELCSLRVADIRIDRCYGLVKGKGRTRRKEPFYFMFDMLSVLEKFIKREDKKPNDFIFTQNDDVEFDYYSLWELMKTISKGSRIDFTAHAFRHSIAVFMLNQRDENGDLFYTLEEIRKFLRHKKVVTTGRYLRGTDRHLVRKIAKNVIRL